MIRESTAQSIGFTTKPKKTTRKGLSSYVSKAAAAASVLLVAFVTASLLAKVSARDMQSLFSGMDTVTSIALSVASVLLSCALVIAVGIPAAFQLARARGRLAKLLENLLYLPLAFPPAVSGLALLSAFGRSSPLGHVLDSLDVMLPFSFAGVVLVQAFVTLPLFVQVVKNGFSAVDPAVEESAKVSGAGDGQLMIHIFIPMTRSSILTGLILCMLRAAGEFGATIMFAGNLVGRTQTVTTRIYSLFQQDIGQAACLAAIQLFVFILPLFLLNLRVRGGIEA